MDKHLNTTMTEKMFVPNRIRTLDGMYTSAYWSDALATKQTDNAWLVANAVYIRHAVHKTLLSGHLNIIIITK